MKWFDQWFYHKCRWAWDRAQQEEESQEDEDSLGQSRKETIRMERERREEAKKAAQFFDSTENATYHDNKETTDHVLLFSQLNLSRPLLRGVAAMGFVKPTPIQVQVIPVVLAGRDVCAR